MASISVVEFEKALNSLQEALSALDAQEDIKLKTMIRDATIQRFEFTCELSWKVAMKLAGLSPVAPKPAIRELARLGDISNIDLWFDFIDARNKSSHSYDEDIAIGIIEVVRTFLPEAKQLLKKLKTK